MEWNPSRLDEVQIPLERSEIDPVPDSPSPLKEKYFKKPLPDFSSSTDFHRGSRSGGVGHALIAWSFLAAFVDAVALFGVASFFVFTFSLLVKTEVISTVGMLSADLIRAVLVIGALMVFSYMTLLRVFLGFTLGEWTCGLRLGSLKQRLNKFYSLKVLGRMVLIFATGLFFLPALSLVTGRDLAGLIVRLPLISLDPKA